MTKTVLILVENPFSQNFRKKGNQVRSYMLINPLPPSGMYVHAMTCLD